jgi:hypothetical protein
MVLQGRDRLLVAVEDRAQQVAHAGARLAVVTGCGKGEVELGFGQVVPFQL